MPHEGLYPVISGCSSGLHESCLIRGCTLQDPITSACARAQGVPLPDTVGSTEVEAAAWTVPAAPRGQRSHTRSCAAEGNVHPCTLVQLQPNVHAYWWRCVRGCCRVFVSGMAPNTRFRKSPDMFWEEQGSRFAWIFAKFICCPAACGFAHDHQLNSHVS